MKEKYNWGFWKVYVSIRKEKDSDGDKEDMEGKEVYEKEGEKMLNEKDRERERIWVMKWKE